MAQISARIPQAVGHEAGVRAKKKAVVWNKSLAFYDAKCYCKYDNTMTGLREDESPLSIRV
ncbi:MAG: hypothetical protein ACLT3H_03930 [Roseburia sp.]